MTIFAVGKTMGSRQLCIVARGVRGAVDVLLCFVSNDWVSCEESFMMMRSVRDMLCNAQH